MYIFYIGLLIAEISVWIIESIALATSCGIGFLYRDVWLCEFFTKVLALDFTDFLLFVMPWLFFIVYATRQLKKYKISKFEHFLSFCLFVFYLGFFIYLIFTGYNG